MSERSVRVACVQLEPVFKDVQASIARADALIAQIEPGTVDVVVLPEMAFTGYCFGSREDIEPFTELAPSGPSFRWASCTARRLGAWIVVGFAQRADACPTSNLFNSLLVVSPEGELESVYAKHHLFETDESWATPGPGFATLPLRLPRSSPHAGSTIKLCPSICMDLNPWRFQAPFEAYELASFAKKEEVDLVVCAMAWLVGEGDPPHDPSLEREQGKWMEGKRTLNYWAMRLEPLLESGLGFVGCNRVGTEHHARSPTSTDAKEGAREAAAGRKRSSSVGPMEGVRESESTFTGTSAVMSLAKDGVDVLAFAFKRGEEVVRATLPLPIRT